MEVRCGSCNKLFRVSDDKITGTGVKFKCTRCGEYIKITREAFEEYSLSRAAAAAPPTPEPHVQPAPQPPVIEIPPAPPVGEAVSTEAAPSAEEAGFVLREPPVTRAPLEEQAGAAPEPKPAPQPESKPEPMRASVQPEAVSKAFVPPAPSKSARMPAHPAPLVFEKSADIPLDTIHPFVSGAAAGATGGLGCALPVAAVMFLAFSVISRYLPLLSSMPIYYTIAVSTAGLMGLGILIGMFLAMIQAGVKRKIFSFLGIVLSTFLGAAIGAGQSAAVALSSGAAMNTERIINSAVSGGIPALLLSIPVVIIRRLMMTSKKESFSARLSGAQVFGLILSSAIVGFAVYGAVTLVSQMRPATAEAVGALMDMASIEGLQITSPSGYVDTNQDLVITGVVLNATDREKSWWYLVAEIYNAQNTVLIRAKMLNGKQLYTQRDYEILAKRGVNIKDLMAKNLRKKGQGIPPKGMVNFEIRVMKPPVGIAAFNVFLRQFDPVQMMKEAAEEFKQNQQP